MSLFGNKQDANLRSSIKMVEMVVSELGLSPTDTALNWPGAVRGWGLKKGSAEVYITLKRSEGTPENFIRVSAILLVLPQAADACNRLYRRILEENATGIMGAAFGVSGDKVLLVAERTTTDLDISEVRDMIRRVGHYADYYDDVLVSEFGGQRYCDVSRIS